jgi:ElaB/YqjD/DUF883 family membrane-anchored ribosome-binding protein
MSKFLIQKKVILILFFSFFFLLVFSFQTDWLKKLSFLDIFKENLIQKLNKTSQILAQEYAPYFFPHFPQRLVYLLSGIEELIEELKELNKEMIEELEKSDCQFAFSQCLPRITIGGMKNCQPVGVSGSSYEPESVGGIEILKEEIADRIDNLTFLREVLKEEMKGGLEKELATLREELAKELKEKLEDVLKKTDEIISAAKENQALYDEDYTKYCTTQCKPGSVCGIGLCLSLRSAPQKKININAQTGVGLDNLKLGKVDHEFKLALPNELQSPKMGDIIVPIPAQTVQVCFPFEPINISFDPPSFASLPTLSFTCPELPELETKIPKPEFHELPEVGISGAEIPGHDWCRNLVKEISVEQEVKVDPGDVIKGFEDKGKEVTDQIDELLQKASGKEKDELEKIKKKFKEEYEKVKQKIPQKTEEAKTPPVGFQTEQTSKEYQSSESKKEVETGPGVNWHFEILSWLMEKCAELPTMSTDFGLKEIPKEKITDCYNQDKVIETIINECESLWQGYCLSGGPEPPQICKDIRYSCFQNSEMAAALQCQELFTKEGESVPLECSYTIATIVNGKKNCPDVKYPILKNGFCLPVKFNPIETLKDKCQELKKEERETPPDPCKVLSLFTREIEAPDSVTYSSAPTILQEQEIINLPLGFGGGIGFDCPIGLPWSPPKIDLPKIVIPDIKLPYFKIPPFLEIKLPNIIIEDLNLPDVELCDLNNCSHIFPSLYFKAPRLDLPSLDLSVPIRKIEGLEFKGRIKFPSFSFSLPRINLFNLLLPKLKLPKISIPSPKLDFKITGIDLKAIFELIGSMLVNAIKVPDIDVCYTAKLTTGRLFITFPDYYFSFPKFPKIPKIDFCKDINKFCGKLKIAFSGGIDEDCKKEKCTPENLKDCQERCQQEYTGEELKDCKEWCDIMYGIRCEACRKEGLAEKAKEIETAFNKEIETKIQKEIDKLGKAVNEDLQKEIARVFEEVYGEKIYKEVYQQLVNKGMSPQEEIDLKKVPFPGVFPVKEADKECLPVFLPEAKFIIRPVDKNQKKKTEFTSSTNETVIFVPLDMPTTTTLFKPEEKQKLEEIKLSQSFGYELPEVPLKDLSYKEDFAIKGPGFQPLVFSFKFGKSQGDCSAQNPTGGNPIILSGEMKKMKDNLEEIEDKYEEIKDASQVIKDILE